MSRAARMTTRRRRRPSPRHARRHPPPPPPPPPAPVLAADAAVLGVLRWIWVEERMDRPRTGAPVRVPIFLAQGECREPEELSVMRWPDGPAVAVQTDDVRRGPDGGVARLHLWF